MNESAVSLEARTGGGRFERTLGLLRTLLSRREYAALFGIFIVLAGLLTVLKTCEVRQQRGDSSIFFQVAENTAHRGVAVSQVFANTQAFLDSRLVKATASKIAHDPLNPPAEKERNMLRFHAYYFFYVIAPLLWVLPANVVLLALHVLSYLGLLLLAYLYLRRRSIPVLGGALFCLLVASHPGWSDSLLYGQFFPDNLFVFTGFAFMCAVHRKRTGTGWLVAAAIGCVLLGERAAVTAGIFALAYTVLYWKKQDRDALLLRAGIGAVLLAYGLLLIKVILANSEYSHFMPVSLTAALAEFHNPAFAHKAALFMIMGSALLVLSAFNVRSTAIAVLMMLPNLLGNIGGAEKVGWATHYQAYYFPALAWAGMVGYETAYRNLSVRFGAIPIYAGTAAIVVLMNFINPSSFDPIMLGPGYAADNFFVNLAQETAAVASPAGRAALSEPGSIARAVPEGAVVSTVEEGMPILYHGRTIRYFPVGIDSADYAVLYFQRKDPSHTSFFGAINFLGPAELRKIDRVLTERMKRDGYDFRNAQFFPAGAMFGIAVVKRVH